MKIAVIILAFVCLLSTSVQASHSSNGTCGNGHLGAGDDCSGTSTGSETTVYGAPMISLGQGIIGSLFALGLIGFALRCNAGNKED